MNGQNVNSTEPLLEASGVFKRFGSLVANDVDTFTVRAGEVVSLLGENGAGKSTLCKILYGYYRADAGAFKLEGRPVTIGSPRDARRLGIGMVFQNFSLVAALTVWENIALFLEDLPFMIGPALLRRRMRATAERLRLTVDFELPVGRLAVGDQQKVEILKQILAGARVLILDEPTKVLAPQESEALFKTIAELRADGYGVVFITHKLREVMRCADRIVVMRQGRIVGTSSRDDASEELLLGMMFGVAPTALARQPATHKTSPGETALRLDDVSTAAGPGASALHDLSVDLRAGEILGVAGVSGNGQREVAECILGLLRPSRGTKHLWGKDTTTWSVAQIRESGVAVIPEDPLASAIIPSLTVRENLAIGNGRRYRDGVGVDWQSLAADMERSRERLGFPPLALETRTGVLSGGNQQRVVLIRELAQNPRLIIALYPTRGLDTRSAEALRSLLDEARRGGAAILLVSEDLDELFAVSDRLIVLRDGRLTGTFTSDSFRAELVGLAMVGAADAA